MDRFAIRDQFNSQQYILKRPQTSPAGVLSKENSKTKLFWLKTVNAIGHPNWWWVLVFWWEYGGGGM